MVFSSFSFLFLFLPIVFLCYVIAPKSLENLFLFIVSLIFYAWGEPAFVFIMLASIIVNYATGIIVEKLKRKKLQYGHAALVAGIVLNLFLLGHFKYTTFLLRSLLEFAGFVGAVPNFSVPEVPLPIGISFFTFQGISYIVDVYRGEVAAQRNFVSLGCISRCFHS